MYMYVYISIYIYARDAYVATDRRAPYIQSASRKMIQSRVLKDIRGGRKIGKTRKKKNSWKKSEKKFDGKIYNLGRLHDIL